MIKISDYAFANIDICASEHICAVRLSWCCISVENIEHSVVRQTVANIGSTLCHFKIYRFKVATNCIEYSVSDSHVKNVHMYSTMISSEEIALIVINWCLLSASVSEYLSLHICLSVCLSACLSISVSVSLCLCVFASLSLLLSIYVCLHI